MNTTQISQEVNTFEEGIEQRHLIDVTEQGAKAGVKVPIAMTRDVYEYMVENVTPRNEQLENTKMYNICYDFRVAVNDVKSQDTMIIFTTTRKTNTPQEKVSLKAIVTVDSDGPSLIVSFPQNKLH